MQMSQGGQRDGEKASEESQERQRDGKKVLEESRGRQRPRDDASREAQLGSTRRRNPHKFRKAMTVDIKRKEECLVTAASQGGGDAFRRLRANSRELRHQQIVPLFIMPLKEFNCLYLRDGCAVREHCIFFAFTTEACRCPRLTKVGVYVRRRLAAACDEEKKMKTPDIESTSHTPIIEG